MKFKILAAWASLLTFLNLKIEDGKDHVESELSQEQMADINTKLAKLSLAEAQVASLTAERDAAELKFKNQEAELADYKARVAKLTKPAEAPATPVLTEKEETMDKTQPAKVSFLTDVDLELANLKKGMQPVATT